MAVYWVASMTALFLQYKFTTKPIQYTPISRIHFVHRRFPSRTTHTFPSARRCQDAALARCFPFPLSCRFALSFSRSSFCKEIRTTTSQRIIKPYQCLLGILRVSGALRNHLSRAKATRRVLETEVDHVVNRPAIPILVHDTRVTS